MAFQSEISYSMLRLYKGIDVMYFSLRLIIMAPIFACWPLRGLGQQIRLFLAYTGEEIKEIRYNSREEWLDVKFNLGMDLPNLPYYIDDKVKLSQSNSIIRYLAGKHGLAGDTPADAARADMYAQDLMDLRMALAKVAYDPKFNELKEGHIKVLKTKLKLYDAILKDRDWLLGDKLSYVDFLAYEFLTVNKVFDSASFDEFPKVNSFLKRFEEIPKIKEYFKSDKYIKWPIHAPFAQWGGKPEENPF